MKNLQSIARHYLASLEQNNSDELHVLLEAADHGEIGHTDYYRLHFVSQALKALAIYDSPEDAMTSMAPDKTIPELMAWLGSHAYRFTYLERSPHVRNGITGLQLIHDAQAIEKLEVFNQLSRQLQNQTSNDGKGQ